MVGERRQSDKWAAREGGIEDDFPDSGTVGWMEGHCPEMKNSKVAAVGQQWECMRSLCRQLRVERRDSSTLPWSIATCRGQAGEESEPEAKKVRQKDSKETAMQCVAFEGRVCPEAKGGQLNDVVS